MERIRCIAVFIYVIDELYCMQVANHNSFVIIADNLLQVYAITTNFLTT